MVKQKEDGRTKTRLMYVRFKVLTAVAMENAVFWFVASCSSCVNRRFGGPIASIFRAATCSRWFPARRLFYPEDGGDTVLRNVCSQKKNTRLNPESGILRDWCSFQVTDNLYTRYWLFRAQASIPRQALFNHVIIKCHSFLSCGPVCPFCEERRGDKLNNGEV
jgi:hypothetical protein